MKKWQMALVVLLGIAVILLLALLLWPSPSAAPEPELKEANTVILGGLSGLGISDALVDVNDERVLVRYNEPPGFANRSAIMEIAASNAPLTDQIILQVFDNFEPKQQVVADTSMVLSYTDGGISEEEFLASLNASQLT
jgi:hypothetical protein